MRRLWLKMSVVVIALVFLGTSVVELGGPPFHGSEPSKVSTGNTASSVKVNSLSTPRWAFPSAFANYTLSGENSSGSFTGYILLNINGIYENQTTGNVTGSTDLVVINISSKEQQFNTSWNDFFPYGVNESVLKSLNDGNKTSIIGAPFNYTLRSGIKVSTVLGNLSADRITYTTLINHNNISVYIDAYSGSMLEVSSSNSTGNYTFLLTATNVPLQLPSYNVSFAETGLSVGFSWSVTFNGSESGVVVFEKQSVITFSGLKNGSYNFSIGSIGTFISTYSPNPSHGIVTVNGGNVNISVVFTSNSAVWAFNGAYLNYSISDVNASGNHYGYTKVTLESMDLLNGIVNLSIVSIVGSHNSTLMLHFPQDFIFPPFLVNSTSLAALNHGINPILENGINISSVRPGTNLSTPIGTFRTDMVNFTYNESPIHIAFNGTFYIDQYSGARLKYIFWNSTERIETTVQSTNIPQSRLSSMLNITVSPSNSEVWVNGLPVSLSSGRATVSIMPGTYYVSVSDSGYNPMLIEVNVSSGAVSYLNITLTRASVDEYTLSGFVIPGNASVVIGVNVVYVNATGYYSVTLPLGNYTVSVSAVGYFTASRTVMLKGNISDMNFSLRNEPKLTSSKSINNVTSDGYNATISNLTLENGYVSLQYTSAINGTITVAIPLSQLKNVTASDLFNSSVYINGTKYTNFTVALSVQGGNYSVVLTVNNLSNDPILEWLYSPSATPPGHSSSAPLPPYVLDIASVVILAVIAIAGVMVVKRRKSSR
ncbi:MAG: PEGA domain-containing protein [Thermoplasmatales archaeon]